MRNKIVRVLMVMALSSGLVLTMGAALGDTYRVRATSENRWKPAHRYIGKGDRIRWRNPTNKTHDVTAYGGWSFSKTLTPGTGASKTFNNTGTYKYRCVRHSAMVDGACKGMCGIVHVF